jgi:hypothetical protein
MGSALLLWASGIVVRCLPLLDPAGRALRQYPKEDGYLMMTIARNIALGRGMSVSDGAIATNGTQPLCTFLWALCFAVVGGDKVAGVVLIQTVSVLIGVIVAIVITLLAVRVLDDRSRRTGWGVFLGALWFANAVTLEHTQNGLETGAATLSVVVFGLAYLGVAVDGAHRRSLLVFVGLGALLGVAFWIRNDAVFLMLAACTVHALRDRAAPLGPDRRRVHEAVTMGVTGLVIALPWVIHNCVVFGSIWPISGIAEKFAATWGGNATIVLRHLARYVTLGLTAGGPVKPGNMAATLVACMVLIAAGILVVRFRAEQTRRLSILLSLGGLYGLGLVLFYGLYFGAPWFVGRFLFPLTPFIFIAGAQIAIAWADRGKGERRARWASTAVVVLLLATLARLVDTYSHHSNQHFQVVDWVRRNVPDDEWVAAMQSGTLGFFHDRTYNLDGKVSHEALAALRGNRLSEYIVSKPIRYIADWEGFSIWAELPVLKEHFDLVVHDPEKNLAVLARRDAGVGPSVRE